tara:strand:- start:1384 stop:5187 length:3804 start_codon:yes stop_codon:yes gene_type:complete
MANGGIPNFVNPFNQQTSQEPFTNETQGIPNFVNPLTQGIPNFVNPFSQEKDQQPTTQPLDVNTLEKGTYTENDLVDNKYYGTVSEYMKNRYNIEEGEEYDRRDITRMFMNNMRGFAGGNTTRAVSEVAYLNSLDDEQLGKVGEAYTLYEGMANLFSDETSFGETAGGTWDYVRSFLADPVNLVSLGVGKLFASGGMKAGTKAAQIMAKEAMKRQLAKGATREAAERSAKKVFARQSGRISAEAAKRLAAREGKKSVVREVAGTVAVDTVQAIGTTYAYENSLVRTDVQEEINPYSLGFAALGTIVLGGAVGGVSLARGSEDFLGTEALGLATKVENNKDPLLSMTDMFGFNFEIGSQVIKKGPGKTDREIDSAIVETPEGSVLGFEDGKVIVQFPDGEVQYLSRTNLRLADNEATGGNEGVLRSWKKLVDQGRKTNLAERGRIQELDPDFIGPTKAPTLDELDDEFFTKLLLGDKDLGIRGITEALAEQGYVFRRRSKDDTISKFILDALVSTKNHKFMGEESVATKYIKDFMAATGINKINVKGDPSGPTKPENLNMDNFAELFAAKISDAAVLQNALSQTARRLKVSNDSKNIEFNFRDVLNGTVSYGVDSTPSELNKFQKFVEQYIGEGVRANQNRIIRLLVSNPSTSALNLVGWGAATSMNSAADMGVALMQLPLAGMYRVFGKPQKAQEAMHIASSLARANRQRVRNLLDPNMTYDAFKAIAVKNPKLLKELSETLSGGVDAAKVTTFNPDQTVYGRYADQTVDVIQGLTFVSAQDAITKSQEFTFQLDKVLRIKFNKSWSKFFEADDADAAMRTKDFQDAVATAVVETQKATYSKSYESLGLIPKTIEQARNVPGLGLLVPFGRFFNNTVNFMVESSGGALVLKAATGKVYKEKTAKELAVRAAIGWGTMYSLADNEKFSRDEGLAWDQKRDRFGAVVTDKYDFPLSHLKAGARIMSYYTHGGEVPREEVTQIAETVAIGAITRQLNQTVDGLGSTLAAAIAGDVAAIKELKKVGIKMGSQAISGTTRFLDPVNQVVGLARGSDYVAIDRRDNNRFVNDSFRYMDQIIGSIGGDLAPQRFRAAAGKEVQDAGKIIGTREVKVSDLSKVMNMIGRADFQADMALYRTGSAKGSNRYAEMFNTFGEYGAARLLKSGLMKGKSLEERQTLVKDVLDRARALTKEFMRIGADEANDTVLAKMIDMVSTRGGIKKLDKALRDMGSDMEFSDFAEIETTSEALQQLGLLDAFFEYKQYKLDNLTSY